MVPALGDIVGSEGNPFPKEGPVRPTGMGVHHEEAVGMGLAVGMGVGGGVELLCTQGERCVG